LANIDLARHLLKLWLVSTLYLCNVIATPTNVELIESPFPRDHRAILLPLFLLTNAKVDKRATVGRLPKLQVLPIAVTLVDAVNVDEDRNARSDELVGREVDRKRLQLAGYGDESFDKAISVDGAELSQFLLTFGQLNRAIEVL
jgi:hypothetical protein